MLAFTVHSEAGDSQSFRVEMRQAEADTLPLGQIKGNMAARFHVEPDCPPRKCPHFSLSLAITPNPHPHPPSSRQRIACTWVMSPSTTV